MTARAETPDLERALIDIVDELLAGEDCDVGERLPSDWKAGASPSFVQVAWDATRDDRRVVVFGTIRVTAWASSTTEAKRLARLTEGLLLELPSARPLTGVFPARDPKIHAEVASFTIRWAARTTPIP